MFRFIICYLLALILIPDSAALSEEKKSDSSLSVSVNWQEFKTIEKFAIVHLSTEGSAEKIGLYQDALQDYFRLRFKNSFAGMEFKPDTSLIETLGEAKKNGTILIRVWTVGEDNPVAYHIQLLGGSLVDRKLYNSEVLGYDTKKNMPRIVRNIISDLIDEFAIFYFENRGEL